MNPITWSKGFAASAKLMAQEFIVNRSLQPIKAVVLGPPGGDQGNVSQQASSRRPTATSLLVLSWNPQRFLAYRRSGDILCTSLLKPALWDKRTTRASVAKIPNARVLLFSFKSRFYPAGPPCYLLEVVNVQLCFGVRAATEWSTPTPKLFFFVFSFKSPALQISRRYGLLHVDAKTAVDGVFESLGKPLPSPASLEEKAPPAAKGKKVKDTKKGTTS